MSNIHHLWACHFFHALVYRNGSTGGCGWMQVVETKPANQVQLISPLWIVEDWVKGHRTQLESVDKDDGWLRGVSHCLRVYAGTVCRSDVFASRGKSGKHGVRK